MSDELRGLISVMPFIPAMEAALTTRPMWIESSVEAKIEKWLAAQSIDWRVAHLNKHYVLLYREGEEILGEGHTIFALGSVEKFSALIQEPQVS